VVQNLGLEKDKSIKLYSNYFPLNNQQAKEVSGGIFISHNVIKESLVDTIFYDKSLELDKSFTRLREVSSFAIDTNGLDPFEAYEHSLTQLKKRLINCNDEIHSLNQVVSKIKKLRTKKKKVVFFLGEINKDLKLPELVMANDGFVNYLKSNLNYSSYPTELAYLSWSQKIIRKLENEGYLFYGIVASNTERFEVKKISDRHFNIYSHEALIPGLSQIFFMKKFLNSFL